MLLLLVSASTLSKAKTNLPDLCKNMMLGKTNTLYKNEANLIKQKYMMQETAAQTIKNKLPALKMRRYKNFRGNQCMDNSTRTLEDHQ